MFKKIALIAKPQTFCHPTITRSIAIVINYLQKLNQNIQIILEHETAQIIQENDTKKFLIVECEKLADYADLLVVIGGDGRFLSMSRFATLKNLPIIGINIGKLGFLTDIDLNRIEKLGDVLQGKYFTEERFILKTFIQKHDIQGNNHRDFAVNDVGFMATTSGKMIHLTLYIDDKLVCGYRADGLLISTPTGSTGHVLSGGGSILHPSVDAIIIAPMFSHNLNSRPIVVNSNSKIKVIVNSHNQSNIKMICDGQNTLTLMPKTEINIQKADKKLYLIHPLNYDYFATLRAKLNWEN